MDRSRNDSPLGLILYSTVNQLDLDGHPTLVNSMMGHGVVVADGMEHASGSWEQGNVFEAIYHILRRLLCCKT